MAKRGRRSAAERYKGLTLTNEKGNLNNKNIADLRKAIKADETLSAFEKQDLLTDLKVYLKDKQIHHSIGTTNGFWGFVSEDKVSQLFANAGVDAMAMASQLGEDYDYLMDEGNWVNGMYYGKTGTYEIQFNYSGSILKKVG